MIQTNAIGLFDSGIGGTSIWKAIHQLLPHENTIYLADSKHAPYGQKSKNDIIDLSFKNTELLLKHHCKLIVVACNTATTNAIKELRDHFDVPFIGIEPAIKPAATNSKTQTIGILATQGTLNSDLFHKNVAQFEHTKIIEQVGHGLVQLIENGQIESDDMHYLLQSYLKPMIAANIDYLVLGCSHYPYLMPQIRKIVPKHVQIIDSGEAVARQTKKILDDLHLLNTQTHIPECIFYTNANTTVLSGILDNQYKVQYKDF